MSKFLRYFSVAVFAIFIGSQITEGVLLVPYWQSLSTEDFYAYYHMFGPTIGRYYTVLTILAALIPIGFASWANVKHSRAFKPVLISAILAILFVLSFYLYFKETNELFYQDAFTRKELQAELITWSYWHWGRVLVECCSLLFLIVGLSKIEDTSVSDYNK